MAFSSSKEPSFLNNNDINIWNLWARKESLKSSIVFFTRNDPQIRKMCLLYSFVK